MRADTANCYMHMPLLTLCVASGDSQINIIVRTKLRPARGASQLQLLHDCHSGLELGCKAATSSAVKQVLSRYAPRAGQGHADGIQLAHSNVALLSLRQLAWPPLQLLFLVPAIIKHCSCHSVVRCLLAAVMVSWLSWQL